MKPAFQSKTIEFCKFKFKNLNFITNVESQTGSLYYEHEGLRELIVNN